MFNFMRLATVILSLVSFSNLINGQFMKNKKWPSVQIPYQIDLTLVPYMSQIQRAFEEFHKKTCIRFVPKTNQHNYVRLFSGDGCYADIGLQNAGQQALSLGRGCIFHGTIVQQLDHAIGFFLEHNRSDRDDYLTIYWQNIQSGMSSKFAKFTAQNEIIYGSYDENSIMHYGETAYSRDGFSKTMVSKRGVRLLESYDKNGLSPIDVIKIKAAYCT